MTILYIYLLFNFQIHDKPKRNYYARFGGWSVVASEPRPGIFIE